MLPIQALYQQITFRLSALSWVGWLDLLLVTLAFYLLLSLMQHSRAALLLRGALVVGVKLAVIMVLLPLPTFDWLVQGTFAALLVALPIIFQPELRRLLEQMGRLMGLVQVNQRTTPEQVLQRLLQAVERMSISRIGALIVLEESDSLQDVIKSGVPIDGQVTGELLQAVFYPENPLHDGAAILRGNRLVAAGCVLPLTQQPLQAQRRLGTRHQAATGLSEVSDALIIVVSEETGEISVAHKGQLRRPLEITGLQQYLFEFYARPPSTPTSPILPLRHIISRTGQLVPRPSPQRFLAGLRLFCVSLLLALIVWLTVPSQTNPVQGTSVWAMDTPAGLALVK
ncbi:MAG: diadenylate cyclase CdaA [Chloroflexota bacterium]